MPISISLPSNAPSALSIKNIPILVRDGQIPEVSYEDPSRPFAYIVPPGIGEYKYVGVPNWGPQNRVVFVTKDGRQLGSAPIIELTVPQANDVRWATEDACIRQRGGEMTVPWVLRTVVTALFSSGNKERG